VHLVGFTTEIYYDARLYERQAFPCPFQRAVRKKKDRFFPVRAMKAYTGGKVQFHSFFFRQGIALVFKYKRKYRRMSTQVQTQLYL